MEKYDVTVGSPTKYSRGGKSSPNSFGPDSAIANRLDDGRSRLLRHTSCPYETVSDVTEARPKSLMSRLVSMVGERLGNILKSTTEDPDNIEEEEQVLRCVPDSLAHLQAISRFSKMEIKQMYRNFKNECPNGIMNEETLKSIYSQFFSSGEPDLFAGFVFRAFDKNNDGYLTFETFIVELSSLLRGDLDDRIHWTFRLYDINRDGKITGEEIQEIVKSVYLLLGNYTYPPFNEEDCEKHAVNVFNKLKPGDADEISLSDFCRVCKENKTIADSLNVFMSGF